MNLPHSPLSVDDLADHFCRQLEPGSQLVVPIANGEPVALLDALEARAEQLTNVKIHQMHALRDRPYLWGKHAGHLEHVSWFLSHITRPAYHSRGCDFAPANFSEVPSYLIGHHPAAVLAAASPPDRHGYFSLGVSADYVASMIGRVPFILEVNPRMPRTFGANRLHHSEVAAWCEAEWPLIEVPPVPPGPVEHAIAALVAERIEDGTTLQLGIGGVPTAVASMLSGHRDLGVHSELLTDPIVDLVECGAVTGVRKATNRGRAVTTFALGTKHLYDFVDENDGVLFLPVDEVNDPREIGREPNFVSINATIEVDLMGQCASETLGGKYWSGSGGQADFARGAQYSEGGEGYVVVPSTARDGAVSRIVAALGPATVVTTPKNTVDNVVTEHGIAELKGKTLEQRALALIAIADPRHQDQLIQQARSMGLVHSGPKR